MKEMELSQWEEEALAVMQTQSRFPFISVCAPSPLCRTEQREIKRLCHSPIDNGIILLRNTKRTQISETIDLHLLMEI